MATDSYPLNLEALSKGQLLTNDYLQDITGVKQSDTTRFRFAVLGIQKLIQDSLGFTAKVGETGLTILTDSEAAEHNARLFDQHIRGLYSRYELATEVDCANLTADQITRHDRALIRNGRLLQAVTKEITTIRLEAPRREDNRFLRPSNEEKPGNEEPPSGN